MAETESPPFQGVDGVLANWRQGDCFLGDEWFLYRINPSLPLTAAGEDAAGEGMDAAEESVAGWMVVSQTCDLVRNSSQRPFLQLSPLVAPDDPVRLQEIRRGRMPRYAFVPGLSEHGLVADLERVMTAEKSLLVGPQRIPGCGSDGERRRLALSLARTRVRFAFPDDFIGLVSPLQRRLTEKHGRQSPEGEALRELREIRVQAAPSWDDPEVEIFFWFVRQDDRDREARDWAAHLESWLGRLAPSGRFRSVAGAVLTLDDLTAREYIESDPLDLDHLSVG